MDFVREAKKQNKTKKNQVLKVLLIKIWKIQSLDLLFLVVFIGFYISRFFAQVFGTSFNIIWKKDFCHKFSFFDGFTTSHHHPLNQQNPLSVTSFLSMLPPTYHGFSRLLCYDDTRKNQNSRTEQILQSNFNPWVSLSSYRLALGLRQAKNVYFWLENFYRSHSMQCQHL